MSLTGGELNWLNGQYGISAPDKSVPVIKLIREHKPKSHSELVDLIEFHHKNVCLCKIISQGTIEDFGKNLYAAQMTEWKRYKYSLEQCIQWEYNLFVVQSLKGDLIEKKAMRVLSESIKDVDVVEADNYYDEELRIDFEIEHNGAIIAGIQVKPESYKFMRMGVKMMNKNRNALLNFKVLYLYYDYDTERFCNMETVIKSINDLIQK
jgi:hypothetical protein